MKNIKFFYLVFAILLFSCSRNNEVSNEPVILSAGYQDEIMFFGTLKIGIDIHLENIDNSESLIRKLIYDNKNFDEYIEYRKTEFIGNPDEELYAPDTDEIENNLEYFYHNDLDVKFNIIYHCDLYVIIEHSEYFYTGGAHGNYWTIYHIIDLSEKRILNPEDLLDQIPDNILKDVITSAYNIRQFLLDDIWPPDSIYFKNGNFGLIWNIYSITPYSDGLIDIIIPDSAIQQYLTDKGKQIKTLTVSSK